jgi:glycosyltransferase involved in cell wall biosynthesis
MRVLVDAHVLDGRKQGTSTYLQGIYSCHKGANFDLYIVSNDPLNTAKFFANQDQIYFIKYNFSNKFLRLLIDLPFLITKYKIDILHIQYIAPVIKNCFWVNTVHDILFIDFPQYFSFRYRIIKRFLYFWSAFRSDLICTVSQYSRERLSYWLSRNADEMALTVNGFNHLNGVSFRPVTGLSNEKFFLCVSRFEPRKNQLGLLRAFVEIHNQIDDKFKIVFVGARTLEYYQFDKFYESLSNEVQRKVKFLHVSDGELKWLYSNCAANFYPSHCEGFGLPVLEAFVFGARFNFAAGNTALRELEGCVDSFFDANDVETISELMISSVSSLKSERVMRSTEILFDWNESYTQLYKRLEYLVTKQKS